LQGAAYAAVGGTTHTVHLDSFIEVEKK